MIVLRRAMGLHSRLVCLSLSSARSLRFQEGFSVIISKFLSEIPTGAKPCCPREANLLGRLSDARIDARLVAGRPRREQNFEAVQQFCGGHRVASEIANFKRALAGSCVVLNLRRVDDRFRLGGRRLRPVFAQRARSCREFIKAMLAVRSTLQCHHEFLEHGLVDGESLGPRERPRVRAAERARIRVFVDVRPRCHDPRRYLLVEALGTRWGKFWFLPQEFLCSRRVISATRRYVSVVDVELLSAALAHG